MQTHGGTSFLCLIIILLPRLKKQACCSAVPLYLISFFQSHPLVLHFNLLKKPHSAEMLLNAAGLQNQISLIQCMAYEGYFLSRFLYIIVNAIASAARNKINILVPVWIINQRTQTMRNA